MPGENHNAPIKLQRLNLLFEQTRSASRMAILGGLANFAFFASYHYSHLLFAWSLLVIGASLCSMGLRFQHGRNKDRQQDVPYWLAWHNRIGIFVGISWGLMAILPTTDLPTNFHSLFLLVPAIVGTAAISSYAVELTHYRNFLIALLGSLLVSHTFSAGLEAAPGYLIFSIFGVLLYLTARRYNHSLLSALETQQDMAKTASELALANQHLAEQQNLLSQEDAIARHVFAQLTLASENCSHGIHTWNKAMGNLSGDLIQIARGPEQQTYIFLGDFTGHGLPAALGAVPTSTIFQTMTGKGLAVTTIASELNRKLHDLLPTGYFCCAAVMELSKDRRQLKVWNGGLPPLIILQADSGKVIQVDAENLPLGVVAEDDFSYACSEWTLEAEDSVFIYSDGLTEAANSKGDMWGRERFIDFLKHSDPGKVRIESLKNAISAFTDKAPATDDISIIEIEASPKKAALNAA